MSYSVDYERRAYSRAHYRVVKLWGKAREYSCISCGEGAHDWAYDGTDPSSAGAKLKYSMWPEFYMPMCHACHMGRDRDFLGLFSDKPPTTELACNKCPKPPYARGLCRMHYDRLRRYGGTGPAGMIGRRAPFEERFLNSIQINGPLPRYNRRMGPCSVWTGYRHVSGFGAIWRGHSLIYVHRLAWERAYGPIPRGAQIKHECMNRLCVRADHLVLR